MWVEIVGHALARGLAAASREWEGDACAGGGGLKGGGRSWCPSRPVSRLEGALRLSCGDGGHGSGGGGGGLVGHLREVSCARDFVGLGIAPSTLAQAGAGGISDDSYPAWPLYRPARRETALRPERRPGLALSLPGASRRRRAGSV